MLTNSQGNRDKTIRTFILAILLVIGPVGAFAQDSEPTTGGENFTQYLTRTMPRNLWLGTKNTFWGWNLALLGVGSGSALLLSQTDADLDIQDDLVDSLGGASKIGDIAGNAGTIAGITAGTFLVATFTENQKLLETSKALIEAEILTAVATTGLKLAFGRERPDRSGSRFSSSFPSGHTSGSFTLATVFDQMYGHKVGIPLYLAAGFVGWSRISDNKHFLSDVIFGAAMGTAIGRAVTAIHKNKQMKPYTILPYSNGASSGIMFTYRW